MKYTTSAANVHGYAGDTLVIPCVQFEKPATGILKEIDKGTNGTVTMLASTREFRGKDKEFAFLYSVPGFAAKRILLVGLGEAKKLYADCFRKALGVCANTKGLMGSRSAAVYLAEYKDPLIFQAAVEGYILGAYKLLQYKTKDKEKFERSLTELTVLASSRNNIAKLGAAVQKGVVLAECQTLARQFSETPSNELTPRLYADSIRKLALKYKVGCTVFDEKQILKERMGGLLAVAQGSDEPPRFVILTYKGAAAGIKPVVLIGKGVTFDTGGISIKPALDMHEMKQDMTGSAVMAATIICAARLKLKINLVGLLPLTENMPSGTAIKPGDIITMRKGKTVEVINTDAEGRLILADALDYANTYKAQAVFDIATLTGAARFILGFAGAPIMGNNPKLIQRLYAASAVSGERVWELPIWPDYHEQMKSQIADLVNSGPPYAGTLAAAAFLEEFIGDYPWAHIDIAYVDLEKTGKPYTPKGPTGFGVRLLTEMLAQWRR